MNIFSGFITLVSDGTQEVVNITSKPCRPTNVANGESGDVPNWNGLGNYQMGRLETATITLFGVNRINSIELRSSISPTFINRDRRSSDFGNIQINTVTMCNRF